jgi:hypothetical protein
MTMGIVAGRVLGHAACNPMRHDAVHLEPHRVSRESRQALVFSLGPPPLDDEVVSLDVAEVTKALPECVECVPERRG